MQIIVDRWGFPMEPEVGFVVEENDGEHGEGNENCKGYENGWLLVQHGPLVCGSGKGWVHHNDREQGSDQREGDCTEENPRGYFLHPGVQFTNIANPQKTPNPDRLDAQCQGHVGHPNISGVGLYMYHM